MTAPTDICVSQSGSDETFRFISNEIREIINCDFKNDKIRELLNRFKRENYGFADFFRSNSLRLWNSEGYSDKDRERIRDYYLYFLHTFGKHSFKKLSYFVSTSEDWETALGFAKSVKNDSEAVEQESIIFVYMIPEPLYEYGVNLQVICDFNQKYKDSEFPIYESEFYPDEQELSVKGALFPQFILGVYYLKEKYFIVNPHIFDQSASDLELSPTQGFQVDQKDFENLIKDTGFTGYVKCLDDIFSDSLQGERL